MDENLPNFLVVGAAKSGTTTLYHFLHQHPDILMSNRKEPRFFVRALSDKINCENPLASLWIKGTKSTIDEYTKLFRERKNERLLGEASTAYLYNYKIAIPEIKKYLGSEVKIIIILRNPVRRAYSSYWHLVRVGAENGSFEECLKKEESRIKNNWIHGLFMLKTAGLYYEKVKAYLDNFEHVKIYLTDDLRDNPKELVKDLYKFLEVDSEYLPRVEKKFNQHLIAKSNVVNSILKISSKNRILNKIVKKLFSSNLLERLCFTTSKPEMDPKTEKYLIEYYREDIIKLSELLEKDLSRWLYP